ncbi:MAG: HDOD domain-containing protein [Longimicrobiales bacterium]
MFTQTNGGGAGAAPIDMEGLELPSFPQITMTALEKARDIDTSLNDLGDVLAKDPGLSVKIMKTVNSAAFGRRQRVRNIHHAVSLMGRNEIESMLIATAVQGALPSTDAQGFDAPRFWSTAAKRATTARALAERIEPSLASESFTAALLQDMAIPLLLEQRGGLYAEVVEAWHDGDMDLAQLERMSFDWDHALVGALMGERWQFPEALTHAVGSHHGTDAGQYRPLPAVALVSAIREVNEPLGMDRLIAEAHSAYGIPTDDTKALLEKSYEDAAEIAELFGS